MRVHREEDGKIEELKTKNNNNNNNNKTQTKIVAKQNKTSYDATTCKNKERKRKTDKTKAKDVNYRFIKAEGHESTRAPHYSFTPCFCPAEHIPLRAKFVPVWFITTGSHTTGEFLSEQMAVSPLHSRLS